MTERLIGGHKVMMFDSIDEMPISLYQLMNEYALIDYEVGSSMNDVMRLFKKMDQQLAQKNMDAVLQIRKNMHQTFYNMMTGTDNKTLQSACFIVSVDGEEVKDRSHEGLMTLMRKLGSYSYGEMKKDLKESKKKSNHS